jgi:hypothetical protein
MVYDLNHDLVVLYRDQVHWIRLSVNPIEMNDYPC